MSGIVAFASSFQLSPIILVGGIAQDMPGQMLPIIQLTQGGDLPDDPSQFFAQFTVIPSGKLITQLIGHYPFANQAVAANAVIAEPLTVSVRMDCPANGPGAYTSKLPTLTGLQAALSAHNASGGLYTIATPSFIYTNCIMTDLTDISGAGSMQVQYQWQFDFEQPLVTLAAAQQAYGQLMNKIAGGTQISGQPAWSGPSTTAASPVTGPAPNAPNLAGQQSGQAAPVTAITQSPLP